MAAFVDGLPYSRCVRGRYRDAGDLVSEVAGRSRDPFTFVQVGSHDGRTDDPLFGAVTTTPVRGILIEPVPELFERLTATHAGRRDLTLVNAAIAEAAGTRELYWVAPLPGDPSWVDQLGSFSHAVVLSHAEWVPRLADRVRSLRVECRTLPSLIREHGLSRVDLLHIDAEGYDFAILKTVEFDAAWAPRCILYEQKHLGPERETAIRLLHGFGYHTVDLGQDVFAFRGLKGRLSSALKQALTERGRKGRPRGGRPPRGSGRWSPPM
ncbi:MAG: FkbM family methyltransferase [Acidimicrobiia bacterium]|nr:FkbM family methyltransferase [Acidimicrobiia bacterium]